MSIVYFLFAQTLLFAIPLLVVALGGMFSERSGVINIALEGIMILGGFFGVFFMNYMQTHQIMSGQALLLVALLISGIVGALFSLLHAFASIHLKADQTISGTALNLFAPAFGLFIAKTIQDGVQSVMFENQFRIVEVPILSQIPILGDLFFKNCYLTTFIGLLILVISYVFLMKTKTGFCLLYTSLSLMKKLQLLSIMYLRNRKLSMKINMLMSNHCLHHKVMIVLMKKMKNMKCVENL